MMEEYNVSEERLRKRENLIKAGINPYANKGNRTHYIKDLEKGLVNQEVCIVGRIRAKSESEINLQDITGSVRVVCHKSNNAIGNTIYENIEVGDFIAVKGKVCDDLGIICEDDQIEVLTKSLIDLPSTEEWYREREEHCQKRYVDFTLRPESVDLFKKRITLINSIREHLNRQGMVEVETPILRSWYDLVCYEQFEVKNIDNKPLYLRLCHEDKLKFLIAGGFEKVYELGKSFRPSDFSWKHSVEFTQLETIQAYTDYKDMMKHAEEMYAYATKKAIGKLHFRGKNGDIIDLTPPWNKISVRDAILEYSGIDIYEMNTAQLLRNAILEKFGGYDNASQVSDGIAHSPADPVVKPNTLPSKPYSDWFWGLVEHCLEDFVLPNVVQPTIFFDYPVDSNWLCKRKADRPDYIERFEAYIDSVEIANCYTLVTDAVDFVERLEQQREWYFTSFGKEDYPLDKNLILAKNYGLPPMSESSFGIDRWLMLITEQETLQDVMWVPYPYV